MSDILPISIILNIVTDNYEREVRLNGFNLYFDEQGNL